MRCFVFVVLLAFCPAIALSGAELADSPFLLKEEVDKLTNKMTRRMIVLSDDKKSAVELRHTDGADKVTMFINPDKAIFADSVNSDGMAVNITMRSSVMKDTVTLRCEMNMMEVDFCYIRLPPKAAVVLFSGDHLTMQLPRTAERLSFPLGGEGFEAALKAVLSPAAELVKANEQQAKAAREAEIEEGRMREEMAARKAIEEKPIKDGQAAGAQMAAKLGGKARNLVRASIVARAKTALKDAGYKGKEADMFVSGYIEAFTKAAK